MNSLDPPDHLRDSDEALTRFHQAEWTIGDTAFPDGAGGLTRVVSGRIGENLIQFEGASQCEAWNRKMKQAREVGMIES